MCQPLPWAGERGRDRSLLRPSKLPWAGEDEQGEEQLTPGTAHAAH